jgi:hypothetical protein
MTSFRRLFGKKERNSAPDDTHMSSVSAAIPGVVRNARAAVLPQTHIDGTPARRFMLAGIRPEELRVSSCLCRAIRFNTRGIYGESTSSCTCQLSTSDLGVDVVQPVRPGFDRELGRRAELRRRRKCIASLR